jgi:hypothetical protein
MKPEGSSPYSQESAFDAYLFRNMINFYGEVLLTFHPLPKLEDHRLSAVRNCLFNIFAATFHILRPFLNKIEKEKIIIIFRRYFGDIVFFWY